MKKLIFISLLAFCFTACNQNNNTKPGNDKDSSGNKTTEVKPEPGVKVYGVSFDYKSPQALTDLMNDPSKLDTTKDYVVSAVVKTVCQKRGCWFRADDGKGGDVFIKIVTEDENAEEVGIPMTTPEGANLVFYGTPKFKEVSVKQQRHYLEDAGASKADIEAITKPKKEWRFYATGVMMKG
jgi:hypothetical protein